MNRSFWLEFTLFLFFSGGAGTFAVARDQIPIQNVQIEIKTPDPSTLAAAGITIASEQTRITFEGWGSGPIEDLVMAHFRVRLNNNFTLVPPRSSEKTLEPVLKTDNYSEYILDQEISRIDQAELEFRFVSQDGHSEVVRAVLSAQLKHDIFFYDPLCEDQSISVDSTKISGDGSSLFLIQCAKNDATLQINVHPFSQVQWEDMKPEPHSDKNAVQNSNTFEVPTGAPVDPKNPALVSFNLRFGEDGKSEVSYSISNSTVPPLTPDHWFRSAQINAIAGFQSGGGSSFSTQIGWRPYYLINPNWAIRGGIDFTLFNSADVGGLIFATDVQVFATWMKLRPWIFSVGGGVETWWGNQGTGPVVSLQIERLFKKRILRFIDRIFLGYSHFMPTSLPTDEFKLGVGLAF